MALAAVRMKEDIISALNGVSDSASNACKKFGDAILANIVKDAEITYTTATGASVCKASGEGVLTPSSSFSAMLDKLAELIKQLSISPPASAFNPAGKLTVQMNGETSQDSAMQAFCEQIINSIKATFPVPGMVIE